MPVINVTYPTGALNQESQAAVVAQLTDTLMEIEGTKGIAAIAAGTWLILHEAPTNTIAVGGKFAPGRYHVKIDMPVGTLDLPKKAELIRRVTDILLQIDSVATDISDAAQRARIYCLINEIPDGGWGFAGISITKEFTETRLRELKQARS